MINRLQEDAHVVKLHAGGGVVIDEFGNNGSHNYPNGLLISSKG